MLRIDFYVQHLLKHKANGVRLVSDLPVTFHFDAGDRQSSKPIEHELLVARKLIELAGKAHEILGVALPSLENDEEL